MSFSQKLNNLKAAKLLTVSELAARIHTPHRTAESWLRGERTPPEGTQEAALRAIEAAPPSAAMFRKLFRLHGLSWDKTKKRWKLRLTLDMGTKVVGKRVSVWLRTADLEVAIQKREAVIEGYRQLGLHVRERFQKPRQPRR